MVACLTIILNLRKMHTVILLGLNAWHLFQVFSIMSLLYQDSIDVLAYCISDNDPNIFLILQASFYALSIGDGHNSKYFNDGASCECPFNCDESFYHQVCIYFSIIPYMIKSRLRFILLKWSFLIRSYPKPLWRQNRQPIGLERKWTRISINSKTPKEKLQTN